MSTLFSIPGAKAAQALVRRIATRNGFGKQSNEWREIALVEERRCRIASSGVGEWARRFLDAWTHTRGSDTKTNERRAHTGPHYVEDSNSDLQPVKFRVHDEQMIRNSAQSISIQTPKGVR